MYLLDTNVISKARKPNSQHIPQSFWVWFNALAIEKCYLSALTIYEIELGILQKQRKDPFQASILREWLENRVKVEFENRILPLDTQVAIKTASLHVPNPAPLVDSFIAGTALKYDLTLVTDNDKDFVGFENLKLFNPFK